MPVIVLALADAAPGHAAARGLASTARPTSFCRRVHPAGRRAVHLARTSASRTAGVDSRRGVRLLRSRLLGLRAARGPAAALRPAALVRSARRVARRRCSRRPRLLRRPRPRRHLSAAPDDPRRSRAGTWGCEGAPAAASSPPVGARRDACADRSIGFRRHEPRVPDPPQRPGRRDGPIGAAPRRSAPRPETLPEFMNPGTNKHRAAMIDAAERDGPPTGWDDRRPTWATRRRPRDRRGAQGPLRVRDARQDEPGEDLDAPPRTAPRSSSRRPLSTHPELHGYRPGSRRCRTFEPGGPVLQSREPRALPDHGPQLCRPAARSSVVVRSGPAARSPPAVGRLLARSGSPRYGSWAPTRKARHGGRSSTPHAPVPRRGDRQGHVRPRPCGSTSPRDSFLTRARRRACWSELHAGRPHGRTAGREASARARPLMTFPDGGRSYLSKVYDDNWMIACGFHRAARRSERGRGGLGASYGDGRRRARARRRRRAQEGRRSDRPHAALRHLAASSRGTGRRAHRHRRLHLRRSLLDRVFRNPHALNDDVAVAMQPPLATVDAAPRWCSRS